MTSLEKQTKQSCKAMEESKKTPVTQKPSGSHASYAQIRNLTKRLNIGINHGFQCSNIRWITRKVFEHKAAGRVFKHLPSDPANV